MAWTDIARAEHDRDRLRFPSDLTGHERGVASCRSVTCDCRSLRTKAEASSVEVTIALLKLMIKMLKREFYGQRSERTARLIARLGLQLEEMEAKGTEDQIAAERRIACDNVSADALPP